MKDRRPRERERKREREKEREREIGKRERDTGDQVTCVNGRV